MFNKPIYSAEPQPRSKNKLKLAVLIAFGLLGVVAIGAVLFYLNYRSKLDPIDPQNSEPVVFMIERGDSVQSTATRLEEQGLVKDAQAMRWYARFQADNVLLRQGAFEISKNQSVPQILETFASGKILRKQLTVIPASTLFDIEEDLLAEGYTPSEVEAALQADYSDHPALANRPDGASLEGYLYPNTYFAGYQQPPQALIGLALDEMTKVIADDVLRAGFEAQNLTPHQAIILASIVEQEAPDDETRLQVAQVFLRRLEIGMPLGADPTFRYASRVLGVPDSVSVDSPYNTRRNSGLPPGPIGAVSRGSLSAVANPAKGDFLYFVSGDDGNTYFSHTLEEHQQKTRTYCIELCKL